MFTESDDLDDGGHLFWDDFFDLGQQFGQPDLPCGIQRAEPVLLQQRLQAGLAPDFSLLDAYDPEGCDERWRIEEERMEAHQAARKAEARTLPFAGADDPDLAHDIHRNRAWLEDDLLF